MIIATRGRARKNPVQPCQSALECESLGQKQILDHLVDTSHLTRLWLSTFMQEDPQTITSRPRAAYVLRQINRFIDRSLPAN